MEQLPAHGPNPPSARRIRPDRPLAQRQVARARRRHGRRARAWCEPLPARGEARRRARPGAGLPLLMARTWRELFVTGEDGAATFAEAEPEERRRGFFTRLRDNMAKSRQALGAELQSTVFQTLDDEAWERLEETLIYADVGAATTARIVERLETEAGAGDLAGGEQLTLRLTELLADAARAGEDRIDLRERPTVILMVGVNGTGKTTTIGKIAWHLRNEFGRSVLLAAGDTFRAAAVEQLEAWGQRAGCGGVRAAEGSDPGAGAFDAIQAARARGHDVGIVDTPGGLHTQEQPIEGVPKGPR